MSDWISVEERMPPDGEWVLVWREVPDNVLSNIAVVLMAQQYNGHWYHPSGPYVLPDAITHWQPPPPGPHTEQKAPPHGSDEQRS